MSTVDTPRIYAACLASYNNGCLFGRWIDCDKDADEIRSEIAAMLKESPVVGAEEYAIHDHENFGGYSVGEWEDIDTLASVAAAIEEHGDRYLAALQAFSGHEEALEAAEDNYAGEASTLEDWAEEFAIECGLVKDGDALHPYIDWERYARDMRYNGDITEVMMEGTCHVFWNR